MLQVTFLGTSGGTPTIERGMPALALKYESELMLWDCGEGTQRQLMRYKVGYGSVDDVFITHPHLDHYLGLFGLLETLKMSSAAPRPLRIFAPSLLHESICERGRYGFATVAKMKKGGLHKGQGFTVSAVPVKHCKDAFGLIFKEDDRIKFHEDKAHSLGLRGRLFKEIQQKGKVKTPAGEVRLEDISWVKPGRKIAYSGDCLPDNNIISAAEGADLLIHEATFDSSRKAEAMERLHTTVEDAADLAKRAAVKRLVLTHISPRYSETASLLEAARKVFAPTDIAVDGMVVDVR